MNIGVTEWINKWACERLSEGVLSTSFYVATSITVHLCTVDMSLV